MAEKKKKKLILRICGDYAEAELQLSATRVRYEFELDEIVKKIRNGEIDVEVFYNGEPTSLYLIQEVGAKGHGSIAPLLDNPLSNLFLAIISSTENS